MAPSTDHPDVDRAAIEARAQATLDLVPDWIWDGSTTPVPVEDIADTHFGLLVRDIEDPGGELGLESTDDEQTISGLLLVSQLEIWVNGWEAAQWPGRRRFTIGHELGHWVMHRAGQQSLFCRHGQISEALEPDERPPIEEEANVFAAALLMPADLIRAEYERDRDFERLCERFGASQKAMSRRLRTVIT